jgi:putative RNA 2'-phosphotransferase
MDDRKRVKTSKFLSLVLRHRPEVIGLTLADYGWVEIADLLEGMRREGREIARAELDEVVARCDKRRFEFNEDGTRIRARQGHSVEIDLELEPIEPPEFLYHGTATRFLSSIRSRGLVKGKRHHVHLSPDHETAVKVGRRHGKPVVLKVLAGKMRADGHDFYLSSNGVWLTEHVGLEYLLFPGNSARRMANSE